MPLVQTFPPYEDESGLGYYRRLAASNALLGWRELASLANVSPNRDKLFSQPDYVAAALGLEPEWARASALVEQEARAWRGFHRTTHDAVCPECLKDGVYVRLYWEHAYATACPAHRCRLVERCQACGEWLSLKRERIEQCACGADLRDAPPTSPTAGQLWLATAIASHGSTTGGGIAPKLHRVDVAALCDLVAGLCLRADPTITPHRRSAAHVRSVQEATEFLVPLDALLANWPAGFEQHVAARIQAGEPAARTLNSLLGRWWIDVKKSCQEGPLRPFLEAVLRVAATNFDGRIGLELEPQFSADIIGFVPLATAAKTIGVSRDRLAKAINAGDCAHRTRRLGTRGTAYEVPTSEVERIRAARAGWIPEDDACELALVSPAVMRNMMTAGVVASDTKWRTDICKGGPIARNSIGALLESLRSYVNHHGPKGAEIVTWAEFISRRMGDKQAIQTLMRAAANGDLTPVTRGRHVGQMGYLRSDVARYFGTPLLEAGMSMQQLAKATGWKWESIAHWMHVGLLESQDILLRGQRCRVVSPEQLLLFRRTYVPLADLARAMDTRSSALVDVMSGVEIVGAKLLPSGAKRGGLIRIADLGRLAIAGSKARGD